MEPKALIRVRLTPKGGRNGIIKLEDGVLHARVSAPPVDGAANRALVLLLSDIFNVPRSHISFQSGETSRVKALCIEGLDQATLDSRIQNYIAKLIANKIKSAP